MAQLRDPHGWFKEIPGIIGFLLAAFGISDPTLRMLGILLIIFWAIHIIVRARNPEQKQATQPLSGTTNGILPSTLHPGRNDRAATLTASSTATNRSSTALHKIEKGQLEASLKDGHNYFRARKYSEALAKYKQAQESDPNDPRVYYYQGFVYYEQKQYEKALTAYEHAISLDCFDSLIYYHQAMALDGLGRSQEAIKFYKSGKTTDTSIDYNAFVNNKIKLHYNIGYIKTYFAVKRLPFWAFIAGIIVFVIAVNLSISIFDIIFVSEIVIALMVWAFLGYMRRLLGIEVSSSIPINVEKQNGLIMIKNDKKPI